MDKGDRIKVLLGSCVPDNPKLDRNGSQLMLDIIKNQNCIAGIWKFLAELVFMMRLGLIAAEVHFIGAHMDHTGVCREFMPMLGSYGKRRPECQHHQAYNRSNKKCKRHHKVPHDHLDRVSTTPCDTFDRVEKPSGSYD